MRRKPNRNWFLEIFALIEKRTASSAVYLKDGINHEPGENGTMERTMAMTLQRSITTAVLAASFALGGLSAAFAHHGNVSEHSTTHGKTLGEIERLERQITADLNRKQATQGQQVALATQAPMAQVTPAPMNEPPAAMPDEEPAPAPSEDSPTP